MPKVVSEETRIKISEALKGKSNGNKGKVRSEELKKRISLKLKGIPKSEEMKLKLRDTMKRNKLRNPYGKSYSIETLKRMADAKLCKLMQNPYIPLYLYYIV